ncbi:hypothetical protein [Limnothrix sp. FACHB-881]|nr:hypothetical protein [Limnothrix sp. FACHB-881]
MGQEPAPRSLPLVLSAFEPQTLRGWSWVHGHCRSIAQSNLLINLTY